MPHHSKPETGCKLPHPASGDNFMQVHFTQASGGKIPLGTKISIALGIVVSLVLLFMFAFTAFLIALAVGVLVFFLNLFTRRSHRPFPRPPGESPRPYRPPPPGRDDDIIDI